MRLKHLASWSVLSLALGQILLPQASAAQKITYTLTAPFERSYEEEGALKPPAKLTNAADIKFALTDNCDFTVGTKPKLEIRSASGKIVFAINLRSAHKLSSSVWKKDENGENKFIVRGICTYVGDIPKKLPDSNFYQFSVNGKFDRPSAWSYPYTIRQLSAMKGGIKETRFLNDLRTFGVFSPIPEIETPKIQSVVCSEGYLSRSSRLDDEETE
jgi:hypothetical protein